MATIDLERLDRKLKEFGIVMRDITREYREDDLDAVTIRGFLLFPVKEPDDTYKPARILKSGKATIVFWNDGTKTVVKRGEDEPDSDYNAFLAALGIKYFGSNSALKRIVARTETQKQKGPMDAGFRYEE